MSADLAESAAISDSVDTLSTRGGLVEETAAAAAAQAVIAAMLGAQDETATGTETAVARTDVFASITEASTVSDASAAASAVLTAIS